MCSNLLLVNVSSLYYFVSLGIPIRTTLDNSTTVQYASLLHKLTVQARNVVRDTDPTNDLTFLRVRSKKHEIMIAPGKLVLNYSTVTVYEDK